VRKRTPYKPYVPGYVPTSALQQEQADRYARINALISPIKPTGKLPWEREPAPTTEPTVPDGDQA
jgi:hypothetical protein